MAKGKEKKTIQWKGFLSVNNAAALKEELELNISQTGNLVIDITGVEDVDVAVIQLIYASYKEALAQKKEFSLTGTVKPDVKKCLAACGLIDSIENTEEQIYEQIKKRVEALS